MRRLLVLVAAIAAATSIAAVVSAAPSEAGAGATGYTIYRSDPFDLGDTASEESLRAAPLVGDVGAAQPTDCDAQLASVDLATGVVTPLPAAPSAEACAGDLAFSPDGTLYGIVQGIQTTPTPARFAELVRFDLTSGAATVLGRLGPFTLSAAGSGSLPSGGITFDGAGTMYVMLGATDGIEGFDPECAPEGIDIAWCLYRVDDPNHPGATTFVGRSTDEASTFASTLAASCDAMFTTTFDLDPEVSDSSFLHRVDAANGRLTEVGAFPSGRYVEGADFDLVGTLWGVVAQDAPPFPMDVSTLDPTGTGPIETRGPQLTVAGDPTPFFNALAVEPLDCTEPIVIQPTFTG